MVNISVEEQEIAIKKYKSKDIMMGFQDFLIMILLALKKVKFKNNHNNYKLCIEAIEHH